MGWTFWAGALFCLNINLHYNSRWQVQLPVLHKQGNQGTGVAGNWLVRGHIAGKEQSWDFKPVF